MNKVFHIICVVSLAIKTCHTQDFQLVKKDPQDSDVAPIITPDMVKHCDPELGYCENVPNYPKALINKIIQEIGGLLPQGPHEPEQSARRAVRRSIKGPDDTDYTPICEADKHTIDPNAVYNKVGGKWMWVVTSPKYEVETCKSDAQPCIGVTTQEGYASQCDQLYMTTQFLVLSEERTNITNMGIRIPTCCKCQGHCAT